LLIPIGVGDGTSITSVPVSPDGTRVTGVPHRLLFAGGSATRVSADTRGRMLVSLETSESHIWSVPIDANAKPLGEPRQVTDGPAGENFFTLSRDGEKLAFLSNRTNGERLFYKNLVTGRVKEVSTEGYRYATPVFSPDGANILCVQYPKPESWRNFIFEIPVSGGVSRKIWDKETFSWLWDWSPDGATVLLEEGSHGGISQLQLPRLVTVRMLPDDWEHASRAHFSHDGKWIVFETEPKREYVATPTQTKLFIAPFRKDLVPRSEWIQVSDARLESAPHFSHADRLIIFVSNRDGFSCIWAQRLTPDMHPDGDPFPVQHEHERKYVISNYDIGVSAHSVVFGRSRSSGNVWMIDPLNDAR
jgi:Tol biopolymer transport system component